MPEQSNSPETESRMVVTQELGEGGNELLFNGYWVTLLGGEKILETDSCDGYIIMWMYLMPLNCNI